MLRSRLRLRLLLLFLLIPLLAAASVQAQDEMHQRALNLLTSNRVRDAFDLAQEPDERRDRFGANSFGQSCLLARRLIEAGTRCVQINWSNREDGFAVGAVIERRYGKLVLQEHSFLDGQW